MAHILKITVPNAEDDCSAPSDSSGPGYIWLGPTDPGRGVVVVLATPLGILCRPSWAQQCGLSRELIRHAESCSLPQDLLNQKLHFNTFTFEKHCPRSKHLRLRAKKDIHQPTP